MDKAAWHHSRRPSAVITCSHRPPCPGCPRLGEDSLPTAAQTLIEELASTYRSTIDAPVFGARSGFRIRARLAVRGRVNTPKFGIFQEGSHRIADIPRCPIHHDSINIAAAALRDAMRKHDVAPYADRPHRGVVRAVQLVVERSTARVQVSVVENSDAPGALEALFDSLESTLGERLHSLWWNGNAERTNVILGPHWQHLRGPAYVEEEIGGARVFFPPAAFGQSNLDIADRIVSYVHELTDSADTVAEFYAGCGSISLGLLAAGKRVLANEIVPQSIQAFEYAASRLSQECQNNLDLHCGPASDACAFASQADVVIVDPPRKGLDEQLRKQLCSKPPKKLIYVSCGLPSLARDLGELTRAGMKLVSLRCFDLFPYTEHVETVALLETTS
jgi:23S rRNA (uracil1939-C5)-methyltransferase